MANIRNGGETDIYIEEAGSGTAWQHMTSEDTTGFVVPEVDSIILIELERVTNGGTDNTDAIFGLFVDLHYLADRYTTPNRTPNFYA